MAAAEIAGRQHGVVTLTQLKSVGLTSTQVRDRVRNGHLHRVHRGVYAVGHPALSSEGRWMAAVLACGPGSVLSHRPAAEHWHLLPPTQTVIDVIAAGRGGRAKRPGLRIHRSSLPRAQATARRGIPVTTPARTLRDLKRGAPSAVYRRALRQAEFLGLPLEDTATDHTRSELERAFLRLCRHHRLPTPAVNARVGPLTVDFLWADRHLVVETDGYAAHRGEQAFEDDHARELELRAHGYTVLRFTYRQIHRQATHVATSVRTEYARGRRG